MQLRRLASGGRIDRSKELSFVFNGKRYQGCQGDTLASALLANGVRVVGRSFKYHRPRGIVGSGAEEPNAIVQLERGARTLPNYRATQVELYDRLFAQSVNSWPSVDFDLLAVNGLLSRLIPAGFYYKTFMWPRGYWMKYEHLIRKASGLGSAPLGRDPDRYDKFNAHCDVLVVGGGPAGIASAVEAARTGARVILADDQAEFGGRLLDTHDLIDGRPALDWVSSTVAELAVMPDVRLLPRSTVFGYYDHNFLAILQRVSEHMPPCESLSPRQRLWRVRAKQVVIATGAFERPIVFHNNDRPGVMLASAISAYINRYAVAPGKRAVLFTNNDGAYRTALDLHAAETTVTAVVDIRSKPSGDLPALAMRNGIEVLAGHVVVDVSGAKEVKAAVISRLDSSGALGHGKSVTVECDLLGVSGGWNPTLDLHCQSGAQARFDPEKSCFRPDQSVQAARCAGSSNGTFQLSHCLREGSIAGAIAARLAGFGSGQPSGAVPVVSDVVEEPIKTIWVAPLKSVSGWGSKQFVDQQNDTSVADIAMAARENYRSIEHVKRYTLLGFGTEQGKIGNVNGIGILAELLGTDMASVGTTTFRPAYSPVTFGALAGRDIGPLYDPIRKTPLHEWHVNAGALFENVGQWKRPWYYPQRGESLRAAVERECLAVRQSLGILDYSTLGKIDVQGPDALRFLNLVYTNDQSRLSVGRCSYGMMLGEDGMHLDDGVNARLGDTHFLLTTTTGGAARVMSWLERWLQTEWRSLQVFLTSVTEEWANISLNGPNSRRLISELCDDIDFSPSSFPFMSFREGTVAGVAARVFRISFSGELAYEINVSANLARSVWDSLMSEGKKYDITPYGTETMHVLRAEKGYVIVTQDSDGSLTPLDLGMSRLVAKNKDCLGKRSLFRSDTSRAGRKQLVGLLSDDPEEVLPEGAHVVAQSRISVPMPMLGHVTSSYFSARLHRSIALAVVKNGRNRIGETVYVPMLDGRVVRATVANPIFYDPNSERQNV